MKPTDHSDEFNAEELRNLSSAERRQRFLAWKVQDQSADAAVSTDQTHWHRVDDDLSPDQYAEIPDARPCDTRTPDLWIKFRHHLLKKVVVARGRYDHDGAKWTARLSSVEGGDVIGRVVALAWARITPGERPWEGLIVRTNEADPW